jgi:hypothetical protein
VIFLGDFSFVRIFLKNYRVTMTTILDTSCLENTMPMVLSARRGFPHASIFSSCNCNSGNDVVMLIDNYPGPVVQRTVSAC